MSHERACLIREAAASTGIHKPYLAKILNLLTNKGLVTAKRGYRGGILLARPATAITILQIVEAVEGNAWLGHCLLGLRDCQAQHLCPTHEMWVEIKKRIHDSLGKITLAEVIALAQRTGATTELRCQPWSSLVPGAPSATPLPLLKNAPITSCPRHANA
jgi:Rrf2 family protein